ncbi:cytochrome c oxidase assembly protein [Psychromicrobium xiongbiense]|uniref:cytochrome c oxidase assembly protein n=1 Tax=Psychromicrobium xiongbiense TaxID=3051184 RepID=UPI002555F66E|nr:cytochrome c oxidase assembly protein [Psychromicrobium sp. YIM S02556]
MPSAAEFFSTWGFAPWPVLLAVLLGGLYLWGRARVPDWPLWRTLAFLLLGLGGYLVVSCGFLGFYAGALRWAFVLKFALLLFVIPLLMALGDPLRLAGLAIPQGELRRQLARIVRWPLAVLGNAVVAPLVGLILFSLMLTPLAGFMRLSPGFEAAGSVLTPLLGLAMVLPLASTTKRVASAVLLLEFLFAFIELLADAIPGIFLRLADTVLDGVGPAPGTLPRPWFPQALRDQQLAGDWLWFVAEAADLPLLILLVMRFARTERRERAEVDALSDDELEALTQAHLGRTSDAS